MTVELKWNCDISVEQALMIYASSGLNRPTSPHRVANMLQHANVKVTAWDGERLVGLLRAFTDYSFDCYVNDIAVDKAYQGQGIGRALIQCLMEALDDDVLVFLISAPNATPFYRKLGFTPFHSLDEGWYLVKGRQTSTSV